MLAALVLLAQISAAAPAGQTVTISCRAADGTMAPCARKLTGGALDYRELTSTSTPRYAEGALYDVRPDSRGYGYGDARPGYGYGGGRVHGLGNGRPHFGSGSRFSGGRTAHSRGRGR